LQCACALSSSMACMARQRFSILSNKGSNFLKEVIEQKMYVLIFSTNLCEIFLILRINEQDIIKKCILVFIYSTSLFLSDFNETRIFLTDFRKNFKHEIP